MSQTVSQQKPSEQRGVSWTTRQLPAQGLPHSASPQQTARAIVTHD